MAWRERSMRRLRRAVAVRPARPNWRLGLRAAVATTAPLVLGLHLGEPAFAWAGIVGFFTILSDKGGPYRSRAAASIVLSCSCAAALALAAGLGGAAWLAMAGMFLVAWAGGMLAAYPARIAKLGQMTAIAFAASLASPVGTWEEAMARAGFGLLGGLWATLLSLALWPLRPYLPARQAIARAYRALADKAAEMARLARMPGDFQDWSQHFGRHEAAIREALDSAREAIVATRLGRPGESARGERLLTCLEGGHRIAGLLESIADLLESLGDEAEAPAAREEVAAALSACTSDLHRIADAALGVGLAVEAGPWGAEGLRRQARGMIGAKGARYRALATGLERLRDYVSAAGAGDAAEAALRNLIHGGRPLLAPLRDHLDRDSVVFRHALRLALSTSAAVGLVRLLELPAGQWVTIAILGILRPYAGETFLVGVQRVLGVVVGGAIAAILGASVRDPAGLVALIFLFAVVGVSLLPLNYGYYALFLTPTFVLLAEVNSGLWDLAEARILNTAIGGALALFAIRFLLPSPEWQRIPSQLAEALRASRRYALRVAHGAPRAQIREARR